MAHTHMYVPSFLNKALAERPDGAPRHEAAPVEGPKTEQPAVIRRTIDLAGPHIRYMQVRLQARSMVDAPVMQATAAGALELLPPVGYPHLPASSYNTKFVHVSSNKNRSSVNALAWLPEGRRCITGSHSGEFSLWNGTHYGFDTIIQAHESPVRAMCFSHNDNYLLSGEEEGKLKYFKPNLEMIKLESAHKEAVRGIAFSPTDLKFATASDDSTVKVWDFRHCRTERVMTGHGGDVKSCDWHPSRGLIATGSKDASAKLWDPKAGKCVATLGGHHSTISQSAWNANGNWLLTASRDQSLKVFDIRIQKEVQTHRGHNRDVLCAAWHPFHEEVFASGAYDGSLLYWLVGDANPKAEVRGAHEGMVYCLGWHPAGHVLATGGGDCSTKFWCRPRPGDPWRDSQQGEQERHGTVGGDSNRRLPSVNQAAASSTLNAIPGVGPAVPYQPPKSELPPGIDSNPGADPFATKPSPKHQPARQPAPRKQVPGLGQQHPASHMSGWGSARAAAPQQLPGGSVRDARRREYGQAFGQQQHLAKPLGASSHARPSQAGQQQSPPPPSRARQPAGERGAPPMPRNPVAQPYSPAYAGGRSPLPGSGRPSPSYDPIKPGPSPEHTQGPPTQRRKRERDAVF